MSQLINNRGVGRQNHSLLPQFSSQRDPGIALPQQQSYPNHMRMPIQFSQMGGVVQGAG